MGSSLGDIPRRRSRRTRRRTRPASAPRACSRARIRHGTRSQFETATRALAPNPNAWTSWSFDAPGSLSNDEVYAAVALILAHDGVIAGDAVMDERSLPVLRMPNAAGFVPDPPGAPAVLKAGG